MRILQVVGLAGPDAAAGGVWQVVESQRVALQERGHDVVVVAGWLGELPGRQRFGNGVRLLRVRPLFPRAGLRGLWSPSLRQALVSELERGVDIAHVHMCRDYMTTATALILKRNKIPLVAQTHGMVMPTTSVIVRTFDRLVFQRALRVPSSFLALTSKEQAGLIAMGVSKDSISKVANGSGRPEELEIDHDSDFVDRPFVFVGRLHRRKQPMVFVDAAIRMLELGYDARFVVAGPDQGELEAVDRRISSCGYSDRFSLLGALEHADTLKLLANARALVLPSRDEPYPMIVLEAASVCCPIVLTRESEISHQLKQMDAALIIDPTVEGTLDGMRCIAALGNGARSLGLAAQRHHQLNWDLSTLADALELHYAAL